MNSNINLIAFGTFGNPYGFRQRFFIGNGDLAKSVKTFDLNTNAIKLFPNSKVYAIRKDYANGFNTIAYSIYTYAKEQNSDRSGTFIGSSILFTNKIAEESIVVNQLNEFQESLINKNVQNDIIVSNPDKLSVLKPRDFDKTEFYLRPIEDLDFIKSSNKYLVVFCETSPEKLQRFLKQALDLLNVYDAIYFTDSRDVAEFVNQKGIFKLIQNVGDKNEFEKEIRTLSEERQYKINLSISEFEKEKQRIEEDRRRLFEEYKDQIQRNEKLHEENRRKIDDSNSDLHKLNNFYAEFIGKISDFSNQLRTGRKLDDVKQLYNENKKLFIEGINQLKKPGFINNISKASAKSGLRVDNYYSEYEQSNPSGINRLEKEYRIDLFKLATFVLFFLLVGSWIYFLTSSKKEVNKPLEDQLESIIKPDTPTKIVHELTPKPNGELNENDYRHVAKELKPGTSIEEVTKIIFDKNPTDIKNNYAGQEDIYAHEILELNKSCFEERSGNFYFVKDTLKHIPAHKQKS